MHYRNRKDAALKLIPYLAKYAGKEVVVLAIPRGGVPVAYYIAKHYGFPVDLLMTKKIGHPDYPEVAIGAVSPEDLVTDERLPVSREYILEQAARIRKNLHERYERFMKKQAPLLLEGKTVIIVDDGIATGSTILSGIALLRRKNPARIVVAVPVAPVDTIGRLKQQADECICPYTPEPFFGVGRHYDDFTQVSDEEVIFLLNELQNGRYEEP